MLDASKAEQKQKITPQLPQNTQRVLKLNNLCRELKAQKKLAGDRATSSGSKQKLANYQVAQTNKRIDDPRESSRESKALSILLVIKIKKNLISKTTI